MATPANLNTLNQYAKGLYANASQPLADFLAPPVVTGAGQFFINDYGQRSSFQVPNTKRPIGGDSTAVLTDGERIQINLNPHALHDLIDDKEIADAGNNGGLQLLYEARTRNLVNQGSNARLSEVLTDLRAGSSSTAQTWGGSEDPIDDIDTEMKTIADEIGLLPNRIVFSLSAWQLFRSNAAVKARYPGATAESPISPNINLVGNLFLNPNTEVMLSTAVFDAPLKATKSKSNAFSTDVWIFYNSPNADMFDGSFAKTFRVKSNPFGSVRTIRKDFADKLIVDWTEDMFINNVSAGTRLTVTSA